MASFSDLRSTADPGPPHRVTPPNGAEYWLISRYDDAVAALSHPALSSDGTDGDRTTPEAFHGAFLGPTPRDTDPAERASLRDLVARSFNAKRIAILRPRIRQIADELLDGLARHRQNDLIEAYAYPLPVRVISEVLGIPWPVRQRLRSLRAATTGGAGVEPDLAVLRMHLGQVVAARRGYPGDDLISRLIAVQEDAELTDHELDKLVLTLYLTGHLATGRLIGASILALLRQPHLLAIVRKEPALLSRAVDELLRSSGPVSTVVRHALDDVEIGGVGLPRGSVVRIAIGDANIDPRVSAEPDSIDVHRDAGQHSGFGYGIHSCVGARLAKAETEVAISSLFERFPGLTLAVPANQLAPDPSGPVGLDRLSVDLEGNRLSARHARFPPTGR